MSFVKSNSANYASVSRHVQAECINPGAAEAGAIHAPQPFSTQRSGVTFLIWQCEESDGHWLWIKSLLAGMLWSGSIYTPYRST
jgi:hypothetical protein